MNTTNEECRVLGCGAMWIYYKPTFRRNVPPPHSKETKKQISWPQSASELHRPSDCLLSAKLVPAFADRGCCVVSTTGP
jgi:hypothetical protein